MTWLKIGDEFTDECADLSDAAIRTHLEGLVWVMRRETGGRLTDRDVKRACESVDVEQAVAELVACGFWQRVDGGYLVRHHMQHQPEPDVIAKRRQNTAERQSRYRRKQAGLPAESSSSSSSSFSALGASFPSRPDPTRPDPGNASRNAVTEDDGEPFDPLPDDDPWAEAERQEREAS